jgi:hypothetical protein
MNWEASFIEKCRKWVKYESEKEATYLKWDKAVRARNEKRELAWKGYLKKMKRYLQVLEAANTEFLQESTKMTAYEFRLERMGWYNCDKFVNTPLVTFNGKVQDNEDVGMAYTRVHLVSVNANVHLTTVSEIDGTYRFDFPKNVPFEILAFRGKERGKQKFFGKKSQLEPVILKNDNLVMILSYL